MQIVLIGAGRLAWHLAPALHEKGVEIIQVYSRQLMHAQALADRVGAAAFDTIESLSTQADLYIIAVSDHAIASVAEQLNTIGIDAHVVHTSGATPGEILASFAQSYGVFYPLQSFSKAAQVDFTKVPFCISANQADLEELLWSLAQKLSPLIYQLNDEQRAQLHLAAVFANNFVNHLIGLSHDILEKAAIPKDILQNIIRSTILKLETHAAIDSQTGPAIREDLETLERHQALLSDQPLVLELYQKLSTHIVELGQLKTKK